MELIQWIENWYKSKCDGRWEHRDGIRIMTLDNPGWSVKINLEDTEIDEKYFEKLNVDNDDNDWYICEVKERCFHGVGDISKLYIILKIFKEFVEE